MTALTTISDDRLVALPGGVIIRDEAGSILGAVGVSGDVSEPDEICAVAGVETAGLQADIGDRPEWHRPDFRPLRHAGDGSYMMQDDPGDR